MNGLVTMTLDFSSSFSVIKFSNASYRQGFATPAFLCIVVSWVSTHSAPLTKRGYRLGYRNVPRCKGSPSLDVAHASGGGFLFGIKLNDNVFCYMSK